MTRLAAMKAQITLRENNSSHELNPHNEKFENTSVIHIKIKFDGGCFIIAEHWNGNSLIPDSSWQTRAMLCKLKCRVEV
jgi:hypothetical protein